MKRIDVKLARHSYQIVVGHGILAQLPSLVKPLSLGTDAIVVTHPQLKKLYGVKLEQALKRSGFNVHYIVVPQGEQSKSAACALKVIAQIAKLDVKRKVFCVALGGGVVGDLTGFVAAVYKRGIPYIQVPTSLLAQVDSAIGGKTAIDLDVGKNLVGAFYQPKIVISDTALLQSLSRRQLQNGLAETVKYGVIKDKTLFAYIQANYKNFLNHEHKALEHIVAASSQIKATVVGLDEFETKGIRSILNYGHTVGHAIEAAGGFSQYQHGESVALGMRIAGRLSVLLGQLSTGDEKKINDLLTAIGLPSHAKAIKMADILKHMQHDKKFVGKQNRFVIAQTIGRVKLVSDVPANLINQAIVPYLKSA